MGFDIAETASFLPGREMRASFPEVPFYPEIGSIQIPQRLAEVFERRRPSILYHAAAYKHVLHDGSQLFEAVENNVIGTWKVALGPPNMGLPISS